MKNPIFALVLALLIVWISLTVFIHIVANRDNCITIDQTRHCISFK